MSLTFPILKLPAVRHCPLGTSGDQGRALSSSAVRGRPRSRGEGSEASAGAICSRRKGGGAATGHLLGSPHPGAQDSSVGGEQSSRSIWKATYRSCKEVGRALEKEFQAEEAFF